MSQTKIFSLLLLSMFLISFTSALDCWGKFEQNTEIQLIQKCPTCSYVNVTAITYPNGTIFLNDAMTQNGTNFNYTLPDSSQNGQITYTTIGDKDGRLQQEDLCILITPTGDTIETGESFMYLGILLLLGLLSALGIWLSVIIPYANISEEGPEGKVILKVTYTKYIKLIVMWVTSGILLTFLTILAGMVNNYVQFPEMKVLFTNFYTWLSVLEKGFSMVIMIFLFVNFWRDIVFNRQIIKHGKAFVNRNI